MHLNTYLTFDGNCREAFELYRSVFGGSFAVIQTLGEGPKDMPVPDNKKVLAPSVAGATRVRLTQSDDSG